MNWLDLNPGGEELLVLFFITSFAFFILFLLVGRPLLLHWIPQFNNEYSEWTKEIKEWKKTHPILKFIYIFIPNSPILYLFPQPPRKYKNEIETIEKDSELEIPPMIQTNEKNDDDLLSEFNKSIEFTE